MAQARKVLVYKWDMDLTRLGFKFPTEPAFPLMLTTTTCGWCYEVYSGSYSYTPNPVGWQERTPECQ